MRFISENIGTIVTLAVLIAAVVLIVRYMISNKRKGKSSCGGSCAHCAMHGSCGKGHGTDDV